MTSMNGKVCVVTGANSGIGFETALALAQMGAQVVMVCRNPERGRVAQAEIQQKSGNKNVDLILGDLSLISDTHKVAEQFKQKYKRLDVLVNNAGVHLATYQENPAGVELTFATNHLGYFLLTHLLLDVIKASAPGRIINVSSDAHGGGHIHFEDINLKNSYTGVGFKAYSQSKLANVLFTYELARRLTNTSITVNCLHPGFVATNFAGNNGIFFKIFTVLAKIFAKTKQQGAQTSIYLATSPEVEGITGKYFDNKKEKKSNDESYDPAVAQKLWELSEQLTGLK